MLYHSRSHCRIGHRFGDFLPPFNIGPVRQRVAVRKVHFDLVSRLPRNDHVYGLRAVLRDMLDHVRRHPDGDMGGVDLLLRTVGDVDCRDRVRLQRHPDPYAGADAEHGDRNIFYCIHMYVFM